MKQKNASTSSAALPAVAVEELPGQIFVERAHGALHIRLRQREWGCTAIALAFLVLPLGVIFWGTLDLNSTLGLAAIAVMGVVGLAFALHDPQIQIKHGRVRLGQNFLPRPFRSHAEIDVKNVVGVGIEESNNEGTVLYTLFFRTTDAKDVLCPTLMAKEAETAREVAQVIADHLQVDMLEEKETERFLAQHGVSADET